MTPRFEHRLRAMQRDALQSYGHRRDRASENIRRSRNCILLSRKALANGK